MGQKLAGKSEKKQHWEGPVREQKSEQMEKNFKLEKAGCRIRTLMFDLSTFS